MAAQYHPRLSVDLILTILPLVDQRTALAVSAANRELRTHARFTLMQKPVRLWSDAGILSFNAFIRENDSFVPHCDRLRDLDITLSPQFPCTHVKHLKETLEALTGLRSLTVRNLEFTLSRSLSVRRIFDGIKHLDVFTLETVGHTTLKFLRESRYRFHFRAIHILDPVWMVPADALDGFGCEDLVAHNCRAPPAPEPGRQSFEFAELRRLHVPRFFLEPGIGQRAGFMYLAPNLRALDVGAVYAAQPPTTTTIQELLAHRHCNKAATIKFQLDVAAERRKPVWTELELVRGGLVDLFMFGNTCRAGVLELVGGPVVDPGLQWLIPHVVLDHEPRVLRFSIAGPEFHMGGFVANPDMLDTVESLYVRVVLTSEAEWAACEAALSDLLYCFGYCRVLCVELAPANAAVCEFLAGKDRTQIAGAFAARTDAVQAICVSTSLGPAYWRVGGARGELRQLEGPQMEDEEGRRLLTGWNMFSEAYPLCDPSAE
ncbi:hypothetical protein V8D89_004542 [Ganoderma adspersum]